MLGVFIFKLHYKDLNFNIFHIYLIMNINIKEFIMADNINTEEFQNIMADILEGYEKLENKQDLDTYLQEKLKEYGVGESEEERKSIISKFGITLIF